MTFEQKKQAAFDALDVVGHGMHDATECLPNTRSACNLIEARLREEIDEFGEDSNAKEVDRLRRRMHTVRYLYYDVAEAAEFNHEEMAKVKVQCYRLVMAIDDILYNRDGGKR